MGQIAFKGIPTFRILDYKKAMDFYIEYLGFEIDWEHKFGPTEPVYMQISKKGLTLHLSENKRFQTGVIIFVASTGLKKYAKELAHRNPTTAKIEETNWQTLQLEIRDPFGNLLRFNETVLK